MAFFYDELFVEGKEYPANMSTEDIAAVLKNYMSIYDENDDQNEWFGKIKELSVSMGYAASPKEFKQNPEAFKGHVGDVSAVIRMAVTGRVNSPDMFTVMSILGKEKVLERADVLELAKYYSDCGADELVFYDITASFEERELFTDILKKVAQKVAQLKKALYFCTVNLRNFTPRVTPNIRN